MKNKAVTIIIVVATVILAGVVVFTAVRLYQLRDESVAPTAPESVPQAQEVPAVDRDDVVESVPSACESLRFSITEKTPGVTCLSKKAYEDDTKNGSGTYYLVKSIAAGGEVQPGDTFVYVLDYDNTGTATVTSVEITDTLPSQLTYVDSDSVCSASGNEVTCSLESIGPGDAGQIPIRVSVNSSATGSFTNTAGFTPSEGSSSTCSLALKVAGTPTSTPGPTATPTSRPSSTPAPTPAPTGIAQATPAPSTPQPSLPDAGIPTPTLIGLGAGSLLLLLAVLALAL